MNSEVEVVYPSPVRRWRPLLRLDPGGLECAVGRVEWAEVTSVQFVEFKNSELSKHDSFWRLVLNLRADTRPIPVRGYFRGFGDGRPRLAGSPAGGPRMELPLWDTEHHVLKTVLRFYRGEVATRVKYDQNAPRWPDRDIAG